MLGRLEHGVTCLPVPHPFGGMIALSSDCDGATLSVFEELHRYLNTLEETAYGEGLGLDISDSMWVYGRVPSSAPLEKRPLSLKAGLSPNDDERLAPVLGHYARAGWIDTLHSIGDFSLDPAQGGVVPGREHIDAAVESFKTYALRLPVWVNHGNRHNIQNIGRGRAMQGGSPDSPVYVLDAADELGIRYANTIKRKDQLLVEGLSAYGDPPKLWGFSRWFARPREEITDSAGVLKFGSQPDGSELGYVWHPSSLHLQLEPRILDEVVRKRGSAIFAQHLGHLKGMDAYPDTALAAFRLLKRYVDEEKILVARTSRLLAFLRARQCARIQLERSPERLTIDVAGMNDPTAPGEEPTLDAIRGLSFRVAKPPDDVVILLAGTPIDEAEIFREHTQGELVLGVRWCPPDTTDYVATRPPLG